MSDKRRETIIRLFDELSEKQDVLLKLTGDKILDDYSISENHCIFQIGVQDRPNVTKLSECLNITKGGISKVVKKLIKNGDIATFQSDTNRKEKYYELTPKGRKVFEAHQVRHSKTVEREQRFFQNIQEDELRTVVLFLEKYNSFLDGAIFEMNLPNQNIKLVETDLRPEEKEA